MATPWKNAQTKIVCSKWYYMKQDWTMKELSFMGLPTWTWFILAGEDSLLLQGA